MFKGLLESGGYMALPLAHMLYGVETVIHVLFQQSDGFGEFGSSVGSKQGCPLGTLLYGCGSWRGLQEHTSKYHSAMIVAIVDDVKRVIELPFLLDAHLHWRQLVRERGGDLKETKCAVWSPGFSMTELLQAGVPHSMVVRGQDGLRNLGGVVGDLAYKDAYVVNKFEVAILLVDRAMGLNNLQERARVIFGALAAQLFYLEGVVPLQD